MYTSEICHLDATTNAFLVRDNSKRALKAKLRGKNYGSSLPVQTSRIVCFACAARVHDSDKVVFSDGRPSNSHQKDMRRAEDEN